jgi:hypothetical protein
MTESEIEHDKNLRVLCANDGIPRHKTAYLYKFELSLAGLTVKNFDTTRTSKGMSITRSMKSIPAL